MSVPRKFDHDECRALYATGEWTQRALARKYAVSATRIWQIVVPEHQARSIAYSKAWLRERYNEPCENCGKPTWKRGNASNRTGLCLTCWGLSRRTAEHGTETRYTSWGCRCDDCRAASAKARRKRRANDPNARAKDNAYRRTRRLLAKQAA